MYLRAVEVMLGYVKSCDHPEADLIADDQISDELANLIDNYAAGKHQINMADTERWPHPFRRYMWTEEYISRPLKAGEYKARRSTAGSSSSNSSSNSSNSDSDSSTTTTPQKVVKGKKPAKKAASKKPIGKKSGSKKSGSKKKRVARLSPARIKVVVAFCEALRLRLDKIPDEDRDEPLIHPIVEVGYSNYCLPRLREHAAHRNSN
jgi:hypothetical protein